MLSHNPLFPYLPFFTFLDRFLNFLPDISIISNFCLCILIPPYYKKKKTDCKCFIAFRHFAKFKCETFVDFSLFTILG